MEEQAAAARKRKEEEEIARQAKKRAAEESMERQKSRRDIVTSEFQANEERYKRTLEQKPLFAKFEEKYAEQIVLPEIERRKKIMADAHERFGSVPHEEIAKHSSSYRKQLKQQHERREKELKSAQLEIRMNSMLVNHTVKTNRSVDLVKINRDAEQKALIERGQRRMK